MARACFSWVSSNVFWNTPENSGLKKLHNTYVENSKNMLLRMLKRPKSAHDHT